MSKGSLRIQRIAPRPEQYQHHVRAFAKKEGWLTALHESQLVALRSTLEHFDDEDQIEIMPFPAMLGRILRFACQPLPIMARDTEVLALLEVLCEELQPESPLGATRELPGLHEALRRTLRELRHWQVSPSDLRQAAFFAAQPDKVLQIADLHSSLSRELTELQRCTSTELLAAVAELAPIPDFSPRILILCGEEPLPDLLASIPCLVKLGARIELLCDAVAPTPAYRANFEAVLGKPLPPAPEPSWIHQVFEEAPDSSLQHPQIRTFSVPDPVAEVNWALRACLRARSEGILEHRMGIVVPDRDLYVPLLIAASPRFLGDGDGSGRPVLDARLPMPLLANGFCALVLQCLKALGHDDIREIPKLMASSYFRLAPDHQQELRRQCQLLLNGPNETWAGLEAWVAGAAEEFAPLVALLEWRKQASVQPITLAAWHAELARFTRLEIFTERLNRRDDWHADADRGAVTALLRSLGGYAAVMSAKGSAALNLRAFALLAERVWQREETAVPTRRHGIRVVSSAQELGVVDLVIVLNAVEGVYPRRRSEDPILFDSDRAAIRELKSHAVEIPDSHTHAAEQRPGFLRLCAAARTRLVFMVPRMSGDRQAIRSGFVEDVLRAYPESEQVEILGSQIVPDRANCLVTQDLEIREALDGPRHVPERPSLHLEESRAMVRPAFEEGVSYKVLSIARECPFRAVANKMLGLAPNGPSQKHLSLLFRIAQEANLFNLDTLEMAPEALSHATKNALAELSTEVDSTELKLLQSILEEAIDKLLANERDARDYWQPHPVSKGRTRLGDVATRSQITIAGQPITLSGTVDGVAEIRDKKTLRFYTQSTQLTGKDPIKPDSRYWIEVMLLLCTMLSKDQRDVALEFQSLRGGRKLIVLNDSTGSAGVAKKGEDLLTEIIPLRDVRDVGIQEMKKLLVASVEDLKAGHMQPKRGEHCERCNLGELCRYSQALVEDHLGPAMAEGAE